MSPRLGLVLLLGSTAAYAQAPGESLPVPPPVGDPGVMAHRFAVGLNLGGYAVASAASTTATKFRAAELAIRYRATPRFELELSLSGGRQVLDDSSDGDLAMGGVTVAARYRFRPDHAWDWWLMGGLGGTVIERHDATSQQRNDATRPHLAAGVGLERRFRRIAFDAELRMIGLGARKDSAQMGLVFDGDVRQAGDLSAAQFTLGASVYF